MNAKSGPSVGLFVTCLVDLFRPSVGFACVKLLEQAGCRVAIPRLQTCCGQPAFNNGDYDDTRAIAKQVVAGFADYDFVVGPSGSCLGTIKRHYPALFEHDVEWGGRVRDLAARAYEIASFLTDVCGVGELDVHFDAEVTYHDSCSGLRELGIKGQPRRLLSMVKGLRFKEMEDSEVCCGFGGTFCVKYPEISGRMVNDKVANITRTGASTLLGGDMGCLLNICGCLRRRGQGTRVYHVAEVLAGMTDAPGIGEGGVG